MNSKLKITCFGEVLWDHLPTGKRIGGAPLNVALRLQSLGVSTTMISSVGNDDNGHEIGEYLDKAGIKCLIQIDKKLPTGSVSVYLDKNGEAQYEIKEPSAWMNILKNKKIKNNIAECDVFIFGSLICRGAQSNKTLESILELAKYKVFDVNLRTPKIPIPLLEKLMKKADFLKFNETEIFTISMELGFKSSSVARCIEFISTNTGTKEICVTRGSKGVIFYTNGEYFHNSGFNVKVKDTVGAGDSFLASLVKGLHSGKTPHIALDLACAMGSLVASKEGANCKVEEMEVIDLMWFD
ncbi:carbohydrate kinase [Gramella sp. AN32]|uniref:Carbohydrate kinase family protein n=1 Tax=Christiangramia antarctica TaxID=2058158 RepID=A0ABW5X9Y3_9FLAO|nr:carbohydrate kinase [Gramella sp. AN32]MCM4155456.1 carbohydrate kinase [Gramella sp. AN32]